MAMHKINGVSSIYVALTPTLCSYTLLNIVVSHQFFRAHQKLSQAQEIRLQPNCVSGLEEVSYLYCNLGFVLPISHYPLPLPDLVIWVFTW